LRNLREIDRAFVVGWHSFYEWFSIEPSIAIKKRPALANEVRVTQIERAVQVPKVHLAEFVKE
jgi:hypothetical protein